MPPFLEISKYTFYVPPNLAGGAKPNMGGAGPLMSHLLSSPAPALPITPFPRIRKISLAQDEQRGQYYIFQGENFSADLRVFFGDTPSAAVQCESSKKLLCLPPQRENSGTPLPVLLVRQDGIM
jgi:TIG domain